MDLRIGDLILDKCLIFRREFSVWITEIRWFHVSLREYVYEIFLVVEPAVQGVLDVESDLFIV